VSGLVVRIVLLGVLAYLEVFLLAQTHLYATALVLAGIGALLVAGISRNLPRLAGAAEANALRATHAAEDAWRSTLAREHDHAHALLDTVPAALLVLESGRLVYMNRAARTLARDGVSSLREMQSLGPAAAQLESMRPGAREVMRLADGSAAYVSCSQYAAPGAPPRRLLALQRIAGDLDAVEAKAWGDMARVLAHEMMNSLTPIASLSESLEQLLQSRSGEEELGAALEVIKRRSHGLMSFVERYRAVAELPTAAPRPVALKPFLDGIERLMSATFREQRISYVTRIAPLNAIANADAELLEQAMINLLRNAVEAVHGAAAPHIEVQCSADGEEIAIEVHDNGHGLPDEEPGKVLTPFFSTKVGGGGIGLSVARHVALAHGGQLNVRRRESGGAVFSLVLPAA
jgi:nitrogen fixation/metabolism regulation signal transduction histidine kinase